MHTARKLAGILNFGVCIRHDIDIFPVRRISRSRIHLYNEPHKHDLYSIRSLRCTCKRLERRKCHAYSLCIS